MNIQIWLTTAFFPVAFQMQQNLSPFSFVQPVQDPVYWWDSIRKYSQPHPKIDIRPHIHGVKGQTSSSIIGRMMPSAKQPKENLDVNAKTIFINSLYGRHEIGMLGDCSVGCRFTDDIKEADAVVWNPRWMDPIEEIPSIKPPGQTWVFTFCYEAPVYMGNKVDENTTKQLDNKADYTMTYMKKSDFFAPVQTMKYKPGNYEILDAVKGRSKLVLALISNCISSRYDFLKELKQILPPGTVDIYGDCDLGAPCPDMNESSQCHQELFSKYKFYASFENSQCNGYITEKFWRAINERMVPIALGGMGRSDYELLAPGDTFIHVDDFGSIDSLARHLTSMTDKQYNEISSRGAHLEKVRTGETPYCDLCKAINKPVGKKDPYKDLETWFYEGTCREEVPSYAASNWYGKK